MSSRLNLATFLTLVASVASPAQSPRLGKVDEIKRAEELQGCSPQETRDVSPSGAVSILRGATSKVAARPGDALQLRDTLDVQNTADAAIRIESDQFGRGEFYLAPKLLCWRISHDTIAGERTGHPAVGRYVLTPSRVSSELPLILRVEKGGAIVQWSAGRPLVIEALDKTISLKGTEIAVAIDSTGSRAFLFVKEGSVEIAGTPPVTVTKAQLFRLQRGQPPLLLSQPIPDVEQDVLYHVNTLYRPWWQKPQFLLPASVLVVGGTALGISRSNIGHPSVRTTINFPF